MSKKERAEPIYFPEIFDNREGKILKWFVLQGDKVRKDQVLAELEVKGSIIELHSYEAGTMLYIHAYENQLIKVGDLIAIIGDPGVDIEPILNGGLRMQTSMAIKGVPGEVKLYTGESLPANWTVCNGVELLIEEYAELFEVVNFKFGGNGRDTFKVPFLEAPKGMKYIICIK